jgi:hypothetical protein
MKTNDFRGMHVDGPRIAMQRLLVAWLVPMLLLQLLALSAVTGEGGRDGAPFVASSTGLPTSAHYYGVAFGDFNNDGNLDIVGAAESNGLKVYLGDGKGNWSAVASHPAGSGGFNDVRVGDVDKDGNADIVVGSTGIKVYKGNGAGGFSDISAASSLPTTDSWRGIALGDVNKDGNLDIGATSGWGSTKGIAVYTGDGTGKFKANSTGLVGNQDRDSSIAFADFNSDGNPDLVAGGAPGVTIYYGNGGSGGAMSWTSSGTGLPSGKFSGVNSTDFNKDGMPDIILSAYSSGSGVGVRAYKNVNNGTSWTSSSTGLNISGDFLDISYGDFDGDTNVDILTAGSYDDTYGIAIFYGDGTGSWTYNSTGLPLGYQHVGTDVGDFNNDGTADFVIGSYSNRGISAYKNNRYAPPPPPAPRLSLREPLGNTVWSGGSARSIGWTAFNGTPPYNITLAYRVGAAPAITIAGPMTQWDNGTGNHEWTLPMLNSTDVRVIVSTVDASNLTAINSSPNAFEIDSAAPTAMPVLPPNGAQGISSGTGVRVRFSEGMNRSSAEGAVSISGNGSPALGSPTWTGSDLSFLTSGLRMGAMYTVTVQAAAKDDSDPGNTMAAPLVFSFNTSNAPIPAISLSAPFGGESWVAGMSHDITWDAAGGTGNLTIALEYSIEGATGAWKPISSNETNDGVYAWTVPDEPSADCFVRATVTDSFDPPKSASDVNELQFTIKEAPVPLGVNLTAPSGGEAWKAGSVQNITWNTTGGNGARTVTLQYSTMGDSGPWAEIVSGENDTGWFAWQVPDVASVACFVKVTIRDSYGPAQTASDTNDAAFTVKGLPAPLIIIVSSPNGGENWTVGTVRNIAWTASGGVSPLAIRLEYSTTGLNGTYAAIASGESNDGTYTWNVPETPSTDCFVRATVNDSDDQPSTASDASNRAFIIGRPFVDTLAPQVQITAPAEGAELSGVVQLAVTASDNVGVIRLEVFIDGTSFVNFSQSPAGTNWNSKTVKDGPHVITAKAYDAAGNVGTSATVNVTVKNAKAAVNEKSFLEQYGLMLIVAVIIVVAVLLLAKMMRKKPSGALPASAPLDGPGTTLQDQPAPPQ